MCCCTIIYTHKPVVLEQIFHLNNRCTNIFRIGWMADFLECFIRKWSYSSQKMKLILPPYGVCTTLTALYALCVNAPTKGETLNCLMAVNPILKKSLGTLRFPWDHQVSYSSILLNTEPYFKHNYQIHTSSILLNNEPYFKHNYKIHTENWV